MHVRTSLPQMIEGNIIINPLTKFLFGTYPREAGNPNRLTDQPIYNDHQLKRFIDQNSGNRPCFITVYRFMSIMSEVDKLFFDFDGDCLDDFIVFYETLKEHDYPVVPVITGKKGFHAYVILKCKTYHFPEVKVLLQESAHFLLRLTYDKIPSTVDTSVIADTRRLCRLPDTLREDGKNYCTYLPSYFNELSPSEIFDYIKICMRSHVALKGKLRTLYDFPIILGEFVTEESISLKESFAPGPGTNGHSILKNILRPCLFRHLTEYKEPLHKARVAATTDLLQFYDEHTILQWYSQLGWQDFKSETTIYQINKCKRYHPYSCKKLRDPPRIPRRCCID